MKMLKKVLLMTLCLFLGLQAGSAGAQSVQMKTVDETLFEDSKTFSMPLAMAALEMSAMYTKEMAQQYFAYQGFEVLRQENYDKDPADTSHSSAYTLAKKQLDMPDGKRTLICLTIRGTSGGEWISNFDIAPSHSNETPVAENFYLASDKIFAALREEMAKEEQPMVLVCGHSRGAACANLVGVMLDAVYPQENVYVYTFATPNTTRKDWSGEEYANIFNLINPCDWVICMPPESWGYRRAGTDIILPGNEGLAAQTRGSMAILESLAGNIVSYYEDVHSLTSKGLAEKGMTAFEFMSMLARSMFMGETSQEFAAWQQMGGAVENDFTPVMQMMAQMNQSPEAAESMSAQHMPDTYMALMMQMTQGE